MGKVPYEVAKNVYYANVDMPTFVPMYMDPGVSEFKKSGDNYEYKYMGKTYNLHKLASYDVPVYRNSKPETDKVEFYLSDDPLGKNNNKIVLVRNDNYFNGTIYQRNKYVEEPEKFAFFSKAVYDFAKIKLANDNNDLTTPVKNLEITNKSAFDGIKSPDAMILNDWQAAPFVALARYKAPFETQFAKNISNDEPLSNLDDETLKETPIISMVGRLATQKGSDIYIRAIGKVFENWDSSEFSGKNKPIFLIGGADQEGGKQQNIIKDLKNSISKDNSSRIVVAHGFACQPGFAAGADFFAVPSRFEPCGLTQGESLGVGTLVMASKVGGLVDTLNRGKTTDVNTGDTIDRNNGILTSTNFTTLNTNLDNGKPENENDYNKAVDEMATAIKSALSVFYNDKDKYKQMVYDSVTENFSWV